MSAYALNNCPVPPDPLTYDELLKIKMSEVALRQRNGASNLLPMCRCATSARGSNRSRASLSSSLLANAQPIATPITCKMAFSQLAQVPQKINKITVSYQDLLKLYGNNINNPAISSRRIPCTLPSKPTEQRKK